MCLRLTAPAPRQRVRPRPSIRAALAERAPSNLSCFVHGCIVTGKVAAPRRRRSGQGSERSTDVTAPRMRKSQGGASHGDGPARSRAGPPPVPRTRVPSPWIRLRTTSSVWKRDSSRRSGRAPAEGLQQQEVVPAAVSRAQAKIPTSVPSRTLHHQEYRRGRSRGTTRRACAGRCWALASVAPRAAFRSLTGMADGDAGRGGESVHICFNKKQSEDWLAARDLP